jgi:hypothetical protein
MARESQGLQIALIVFVMFTVIFGVATFVLYRSYNDQVVKADDAAKKEQQRGQELRQAQDENGSLKKMIGYGATEQEKTILEAFNKTMEEQLQNIPAAQRSYKKAVDTLAASLKAKSDALASEQAAHQNLKNTLAAREKAADQKFQQALAAQQAAQKDAGDERTKFGTDRTALTSEREQLRQTVATTQQKADAIVGAAQGDKDRSEKELKRVVGLLTRASDTINRFENPVVDVPCGKIEWVNQRSKSVWINLGQADYLNRLTTFRAYDAGIGNVTQTKGKASIEVTQILGPHLAEARITEDTISNPILPGDVIHTPIWEPGKQKRFALVGLIDVDGDGKSDLDMVINLVRMSGGVVDAWQGADGKVNGKMIPETSYVVVGKEPSETASKDYVAAYGNMMRDANNWALRRIGLQDLLAQMGHRPEQRVVHFGSGAAPGQFRPTAPEGAPKKSNGPVAPTFQERQPPAKNGKSAF